MDTPKTPLHGYLKGRSPDEREAFALRCGTTIGHLTNVALKCKPCGPALAVAIERETRGAIRCEAMCNSVDWAVVRKRCKASTVAA